MDLMIDKIKDMLMRILLNHVDVEYYIVSNYCQEADYANIETAIAGTKHNDGIMVFIVDQIKR